MFDILTNTLEQLPNGIRAELESSVSRTGLTKALEHATRRLPEILAMTPEQFEHIASTFIERR